MKCYLLIATICVATCAGYGVHGKFVQSKARTTALIRRDEQDAGLVISFAVVDVHLHRGDWESVRQFISRMRSADTRNMAEARQHFEEALPIFRRLGARPYVERNEAAIASLQG